VTTAGFIRQTLSFVYSFIMAEATEVPLFVGKGMQGRGPKEPVVRWGYALAPLGKYD